LAGDLARSLGAPRLAACLHLRAWRRARSDHDALAAGLQVLLERRGAWAVWQQLRPLTLPEGKQAPLSTHKLWLLRAQAAGAFRDFETADSFWQRAEKMAPRSAGVHVIRAVLLEQEDRFEEGLVSARRAFELCATYAPAVARTAHLLQKLERDDEALALLREAAQRLESVPLLMQLAGLESALELHLDGLKTLDRICALSPLIERAGRQWVLGLRVQLAWRGGDVPRAVAAARELGDPVSVQFAERAEASGSDRRRVQLEVPFVAQHHSTCAPATMAALSQFWKRPIDQMKVANEITYGGTSPVRQRQWLEQNGWATRAFTVTWESGCALLDRGVPFEISTFDATCGHAQAVCGYDLVQRTLLIRDPLLRHLRQVEAEPFLKFYRATGPTGLVLVPLEKANLLEGVELPDARLQELLHKVWEALDTHDREAARELAASMQATTPEHWLTLRAGLALAHYDGNVPLALEYLDRLLQQFPGDPRLLLEKLAGLAEHDLRDERLDLLARACGQPQPHPLFFVRYAQELCEDARQHLVAAAWIRRAMRLGEVAGGMSCLAGLFWQRRRFEEALEMYRFGTCLADTQENAARQYFNAARYLNRTEQALQFLRARFERFGRKSPEVAVSLCSTLHNLGRHQEARDVLESAQKLLPENASLDFFAAQAALRAGQPEQAEAHLERAQGRVAPVSWRCVAARIAEQRGELGTALAGWRELVAADPHSAEGHSAIAQLVAETEGRPAALRHLEQACARFPWHVQLHRLWFSWQQGEDLLSAEPIADRLLQLNPRDADAYRQKARMLTARGKFDEALQAADTAVALDPTHPQGHAWRGRVLLRQGQLAAAQETFRRAIALAVDYGEYMAGLLDCCKTMFDRRLALDFIRSELAQHLVYGDGILAFCELASRHLPGQELLKVLRQFTVARPDLWHAWAALIRQLAVHGESGEAIKVAQAAIERLPDSAALWRELAALYRHNSQAQAEIEAREKVVQLNPVDPDGLCRLADALDRHNEPERARSLLEEALLQQPRLGFARVLLAKVLWRQEKRDHALEHIKQAIRFTPENEQAWAILSAWARVLELPNLVLDTAKGLTEKRRDDPAVWLRLARLHLAANDTDSALVAVEKALVMHPRSLEAHDLRISLLTRAERLDEALAACRSDCWGAAPPPLLQAREANVLYLRGEHAAAVTALQKVLEQTPNLLWGWRLLGGWHLAAGRRAEAEAVAQRLLEIGSRDADSYFWVAQMKLNANQTAEGVDLLERALELDPDHLQARVRLMYAQLSTNQFNALDETLRQLHRLGAADWVAVGQSSLALKRRDLAAAFQNLARLCDMPGAEDRALFNTIRAIQDYGGAAALEKVLRDELAKPAPRPMFGSLWVETFIKQGRLPRAAKVLKLCQGAELRRDAINTWLQAFASLPEKRVNWVERLNLRRDLRRFERVEGDWLNKDHTAWSYFGIALDALHARRAAGRWYAGWRERPALRSWALHNVMNVLAGRGSCAEAIEAGRMALAPTSGQHTAETVCMLAWLEANAGQADQADQRLRELKAEQLQPVWRLCLEVINAAMQVHRAPAEQRRKVARAEWQKLLAARDWRGLRTWDLVFRRLFRDSIALLATNGATWRARLWARRITWRWPWTRGG
jgi:tetratricopeptide (TPR) repeat protein